MTFFLAFWCTIFCLAVHKQNKHWVLMYLLAQDANRWQYFIVIKQYSSLLLSIAESLHLLLYCDKRSWWSLCFSRNTSLLCYFYLKKILQLYVTEYVTSENFREVSYMKPLNVLWFLEGYTHCKASTETWASECVLDFSLEKSFMCFFILLHFSVQKQT